MTPVASSSLAAASPSRSAEALQSKAALRRAERCDHESREASRCEDRERSEGPRRSPLLRALVAALREVLGGADGAGSTAAQADAKAAAPAGSPARTTTSAKTPTTTDAAATDAAQGTESTAPAADGGALEEALAAFARALVQAMRGGHEHECHGRGHHYGHGRGRGWGDDPAQRLDKLAGLVAQGAGATAGAKAPGSASTTTTTPKAPTAPTAPAAPAPAAVDAAAAEAVPATEPAAAAAAAPAPLVIEIRLVTGVSSASPWVQAADELVDAFGALQQALGRSGTTAPDEGSVREQLATFLRDLAARLRGDEAAMSEPEPTRPGTLLSVTA